MLQHHIYSTDFYYFLLEVEKAVKEGYTFSDKNEYFPISNIGHYTATMLKPTEEEAAVEEKAVQRQEEIAAEKQAVLEKVGEDQAGAAVAAISPQKKGRGPARK